MVAVMATLVISVFCIDTFQNKFVFGLPNIGATRRRCDSIPAIGSDDRRRAFAS